MYIRRCLLSENMCVRVWYSELAVDSEEACRSGSIVVLSRQQARNVCLGSIQAWSQLQFHK